VHPIGSMKSGMLPFPVLFVMTGFLVANADCKAFSSAS